VAEMQNRTGCSCSRISCSLIIWSFINVFQSLYVFLKLMSRIFKHDGRKLMQLNKLRTRISGFSNTCITNGDEVLLV